jgi:hypothetical protein
MNKAVASSYYLAKMVDMSNCAILLLLLINEIERGVSPSIVVISFIF